MRTILSYSIRLSFLLALVLGLILATSLPAPVQADCEAAWSVVSSPNGSGDDNNLGDVTVVSANDIWAVGTTGSGANPLNTLTEHWNGSSWSVFPSPNGTFPVNYLTSVSAVSSNDVWAVGYTFNGIVSDSQSQTLILHWNGTSWSVVPSPNTSNPENRLLGVAAISANDVWAVGHWYDYSVFRTLIMHWNGTNWSIVSSPNPSGSFANFLYGIDAISANNVWAVGSQQDSIEQTLAMRWNGTSWAVVPTPQIGFFHNKMLEVHAVSANDIWAVGFHQTVIGFSQPYQTSTFHYNGTTWSAVPSPNVNQLNNYLFDVVGLAANDAWAVGFWDTGNALNTMIQHWNGTSWTIETSPSPGQFSNELTGIDAVSATDIWTVGRTVDSFVGVNTLVEHYSASCPTPTPTKTPTSAPGTPTPTKTPRGTAIPTATTTPTPGGGGTMHVGDLDGTSVPSGTGWNATVTFTVHNQSETPVAGAVISGSWSNGSTGSGSCTTNASGQCSLTKTGIRNSSNSVTFTVTNVTHSSFTYQPGSNHDPDGDSNGTVIVVAKP